MPPKKPTAARDRAVEFEALATTLVMGDGTPRTPVGIVREVAAVLEATYQRGHEAGRAAGKLAAVSEALAGIANARAALDHAQRPLELEAAELRSKAGIP